MFGARVLGCAVALAACNSPDAVLGPLGEGGASSTSTGDLVTSSSGSSIASGSGSGGAGDGGTGGGSPSLPVFETLWGRRYGSPDEQRGAAIATVSNGVAIAASLRGAVTLDEDPIASSGNADVLLFRLDAQGALASSVLQGDGALQEIFGLAASPIDDHIALGGTFTGTLWGEGTTTESDAWYARLRPDGSLAWFRRRASERTLAASFDDSNRVVLAGDFEAVLDLDGPGELASAGGLDAFVTWQNNNGDTVQSTQVGSEGDDALVSLATDASGAVFAVGYAGGVLETAEEQPFGGGRDALLASFAPDGAVRFIRVFGDVGDQVAEDVAVDPVSGDIVVVGWFEGAISFGESTLESVESADAFVMKMTRDGEPVFSLSLGGLADQRARSVAIDGTGRILVAGDFEDTLETESASLLVGRGGSDVFLVALDEDGTPEAAQAFGDDETQYAEDVAVDAGDNVYLLLSVQGEVDLGEGPVEGVDTSFDIAIAKLRR